MSKIVSVIFKRPKWTLAKAKAWLKKHSLETEFRGKSPYKETENYFHFHQHDTTKYKGRRGHMRTMDIGKGIKLVIGIRGNKK